MARFAQAIKAAAEKVKPPRLRRGNARKRCQLCKHYRPTAGTCGLYGGYPVRSTQLCDSFAAAGRPEGG